MSFNNISFILHKPQLSENIGACARAIKNFNFKRLIVVKPKPIFPNDKILATSVGAKDLIIKTKVYETLESKIKFLAPTDVAKILSFGKIGFGFTITNFLKLKFFIALAQAPIFSDNWGWCKMNEILLNDINSLIKLIHDFYYSLIFLNWLNL